MNDEDDLLLHMIENTAGRNNQLAIRQATQFGWNGAHLGKFLKHSNRNKYLLHPLTGGRRIVQRNIICNRIQILNRRISPDYSSHRFNRSFAWTWVEVRPSWIALSPRAIPSSTRIRF